MVDTLILANLATFSIALVLTSIRFIREKEMKAFRLPPVFISFYVFMVYLLAVVGVIPEENIRIYMRWFQIVVAAYIILEVKHG